MTKTRLAAAFLILLGAAAGPCRAQEIIGAATAGDLAKVREIVEKAPAALSVRSADGRTPLHWAARGVHFEVLRYLVERGADVKAVDAGGGTPLHSAAARGHLEACRLLVEKGAPVEVAMNDGSTPFCLAARGGFRDVLEFLLAQGARKEDLERRDPFGRTPLCSAARDGGGDAAVIRTLIDLGADVNAADRSGWTPIELAAWRPYPAVVDVLLDAGADLKVNTAPNGKRLLGFAANGLERLFDRMVELGADLDVPTAEGGTLLYAAAGGGSRRILEILVARGFDVNGRDRFGWAPLHVAVEQGRRENIAFLLEKGADLNARNALGQTPFNLAVEREDPEMVELLKDLGADVSAPRFPEISGPCLGWPRPGLTPEDFAPGIVSHRYRPHSTVAVSPAGDEIFWNPMIESKGGGYSYGYLVTTRLEGGRWTCPRKAAFSERDFHDDHPVFSADGKTLFFLSVRPSVPPDAAQGPRIWSVTRTENGWSEPRLRADLPGLSFDEMGNCYHNDGRDIVVSRRTGDGYAPPERLGPEVNFGGSRSDACVSPRGDFLIFRSDRNSFVSFCKEDGGWGPAVSLEKLLGNSMNFSFTGPYLIAGGPMATRWVDLRAIEAFRPAARSAGAQEIFDAVKAGDLAKTKAMMEKDPSLVRARDASGFTPLHAAAIAGSAPLAEWLLANGAEIDAENPANLTPLTAAIANQQDDVALLLIDRGADIAKNGGALVFAAMRNRTAVAERLIAKGADIEQKRGEYTPLGHIVRGGLRSFEVFELLLRKGAAFNLRDSLGNTPLDNAAIYGEDGRMIDLLLDRSAEVNTDPGALRMTMCAAAQKGHIRLFEYYRARGGEALFANEPDRQSFMWNAIVGGSVELVTALRARHIPLVLGADARGWTPLHSLASRLGTLAMIELLAKNGVELDVRTNDGRSAYNIAEASGNREAAALLVKLGASAEPQKFPVLTGPYLGQAPPGEELRRFAPGIIEQDHGTISFSPDGQEVYWPTGFSIMTMKIRDGRWTQPAYASFSGPSEVNFYDDVPFVAPDNKRLYFTSLRPLGMETSRKENVWFVERTAEGWSEPRPVGEAVNSLRLHWQVSVSNSGTLYFGGVGDILCSRLVDGRYAPPVALGPEINTPDQGEGQPFIAPDESYILFWRAAGQVPTACVSFKGSDGAWRPAVKLDLPWSPGGLIVSPDGKYLFTGGRWISAAFIEAIRPKAEHP